VILATNVAETSLTIPGIVYVVDTGVARLSRYDSATGTTRLQIEEISRASADQRKGRCGRVREGLCVRLYDEVGFATRPSSPIRRSSAPAWRGVILRMKALRLGAVEDFRFLDAPLPRSINEGYRVLEELGALDAERALTPLGWRLAQFPVDPRIARMILAGAERGCLEQVLVLAAALGIQDPRERPRGAEQKADELHRRFRDERSDFVGLARLWAFVNEAAQKGTSQLRRTCQANFLSFARVREWREVRRQLAEVVSELELGAPSGGAAGRSREEGHTGSAPARRGRREPGVTPPARRRRAARARPGACAARRSAEGRRARRAQHRRCAREPLGAADARRTRRAGDAVHRALLERAALAHRPLRSRAALLPGRAPDALRHPSLLGAGQETAAVGDGLRARADHAPVRRTLAKIEPEWLDEVGGALLKRSYSDPHWSEKSARGAESRSTRPCSVCPCSGIGAWTTPGSSPRARACCSSSTRWCAASMRASAPSRAQSPAPRAGGAPAREGAPERDVRRRRGAGRLLRAARARVRDETARRSRSGARWPNAASRACSS
jgi:HrpA-like RNA helicase